MCTIPNLLSLTRLALVPALLGLAWSGHPILFLAVLCLSLSTDILDGFAARALGACSPLGTKLDSWADLLTYAVLLPSVLWLWPEAIVSEAPFVLLALVSFVLPTLYGFVKFGRLTSYHTLGAKLSALLIGPGLLLLLAFDSALLFRIACVVVALSAVEEMAITWRLRGWESNVKSLLHVVARERDALAARHGSA